MDEIKPRPIKGIGYGNIFQDGMVKLKPATGTSLQESKVSRKDFHQINFGFSWAEIVR